MMLNKTLVCVVVLLTGAYVSAQPVHRGDAVFLESMPVVERGTNGEQQGSYEQSSNKSSPSMFRIFGGVAFPVGDFAKTDGANAGYAKTGWTAGAQFVSSEAVGFIVEGSYIHNNTVLPSSYSPADGNYEHTGWTSVLALAGLKIGTKYSSETNFFIAPLVGVLFEQYPEITLTSAITSKTTTSPSSSSSALAYGAAVEVLLWNHVALGAKFIASKPKFILLENGNNSEIDQTVGLLVVSLGVAF